MQSISQSDRQEAEEEQRKISAAVPLRARSYRAPWAPYVLFTFLAIAFLLPFLRFVLSGSDEGSLLCGAVKILQGQIFGRDFFEVMGPGTFYLLAGFFKLFGSTFAVARIYLLLSFLGTAIGILLLSRRLCGRHPWLPALLLAGTYFGVLGASISYHVDSNLFSVLAVICMICWRAQPRNVLLIAAGALAGVTTFVFQPKGVFLLCALALWLCLQRKAEALAVSLCVMVTAYLAVVGAALAYFWSRGALSGLVYANYTFPTHDYGAVNRVPYGFGIFKSGLWAFWASVFHGSIAAKIAATTLVIPDLLIAVLPFLLLVAAVRFKWKSASPDVLLIWLCGSALWLSEIHRRDIYHLLWGAPLLIVIFVHLLSESRRRRIADGVAAVLYVSAILLAGSNFLLVAEARPVAARVGTITSIQPDFAAALTFLNQHVPRNAEILAYPYCPEFYFLSATNNPIPYSLLVYDYNTPSQFQEAVRILEERQVKYVVWDTNYLESTEKRSFPNAPSVDPRKLIMEPYLESHYKQVENYGGIRIMERLNGSNPGGPDGRLTVAATNALKPPAR